MTSLTRTGLLAAALGGGLWTAKALIITANDGSFDPLEGVFFLGGLAAVLTAAVLLAIALTARAGGVGRVVAAAAATVGLVAATLLVESAGKSLVAGLASGDNLGLEEEGGILLCGLAWLAVGVIGLRRRRSAVARPALA